MSKMREMASVGLKLLSQSYPAVIVATLWSIWDLHQRPVNEQSVANFLKAFAPAFFFAMWFVGQWLRAGKQLADDKDSKQFESMHNLLKTLHEAVAALNKVDAEAPEPAADVKTQSGDDEAIRLVLNELPKSPIGALVILAAEIERKVRRILFSTGWFNGLPHADRTSVKRSMDELARLKQIPSAMVESVSTFLKIRNRVLHGKPTTDAEVLRAVDLGLQILRSMSGIRFDNRRVRHSGLDAYVDRACVQKRDGVWVLVLDTSSNDGRYTRIETFPTKQPSIPEGHFVTYEWDLTSDEEIGDTWYLDPTSGEARNAWGSSRIFTGRDIETL